MNFLDIAYSTEPTLHSRLRVLACAAMLAANREREQDAIRRELAEREALKREWMRDGIVYRRVDDPDYPGQPITAVDREKDGYTWAPIGHGATEGEALTDLIDAELHDASL